MFSEEPLTFLVGTTRTTIWYVKKKNDEKQNNIIIFGRANQLFKIVYNHQMEDFFKIQDAILALHANVKKSKKYTQETKTAKINQLGELKNELKNLILSTPELKTDALVKRYNIIKSKVQESITELNGSELNDTEIENKDEDENNNMTSVIEMIKVITSLLPVYDGNSEKLNGVLSALNVFKTLINDANENAAMQTILSRLEGKARAAATDNPANVDVLIANLTAKCKSKITPDAVLAKLNATKQHESFENFTNAIEKLTIELERAYISDDVQLETATKLATNAGIKALISGIRNNETRLLLKAGQFDSLAKAVQKATENEASTSQNPASILQYSMRRNESYRGRGSSYRTNQGYNRFQRGFPPQQRQFYSQRGGNHQQFSYPQRRNSQQGTNYSQNANQGYRNYQGQNNRQRVFYASSENPQTPQQETVGGAANPAQPEVMTLEHMSLEE